MREMLENVRLDAISKLKSEKEEQCRLADAVSAIMDLSDIAQRKGLLALEEETGNISSEFLKSLIMLVVDGTEPEVIVEMATNEYWVTVSEGAQAMMDYMYLRGMLGIQSGEDRGLLEKILLSLMPLEQRNEYIAKMVRETGRSERMSRTEIEEKLAGVCPSFQDKDVWEKIDSLEKQICLLPDRSLQRLLRDVDHRTLAVCVYAGNEETRRKMLGGISQRRVDVIMKEIVCGTQINEREIFESIEKIGGVISQLQMEGEIHVLNAE